MIKSRKFNIIAGLISLILMLAVLAAFLNTEDNFSERVKIVLRDVGNQLLLSEGDSTSLIKPVLKLSESKYQMSFDKSFGFKPGNLVEHSKDALLETGFAKEYIVEVIQCKDGEVAHSFEIKGEKEKDIVACSARELPSDCYHIVLNFTGKDHKSSFLNYTIALMVLLLFVAYFGWKLVSEKPSPAAEIKEDEFSALGSFQFYPDQNKLVKQSFEIGLSRKECELLSILVENLNQVVKRDELSKKVWEDNGVIVGRSLDTYISKLRKKLKEDESVSLTNIHGVGYKLEIKN